VLIRGGGTVLGTHRRQAPGAQGVCLSADPADICTPALDLVQQLRNRPQWRSPTRHPHPDQDLRVWEPVPAALIEQRLGRSREGMTMDAITTDFGEVLLWSFWFFIWIAALMVWFRCLFDLFSDSSLSGWAKAGWALLLIFVPWLGALIYLIARGRSMTERQRAALEQRQAEQDRYIQQVAGASQGPTEQIASAKALLDSGALTQAEYESLKAKALA
jgi:hypothetical protein